VSNGSKNIIAVNWVQKYFTCQMGVKKKLGVKW